MLFKIVWNRLTSDIIENFEFGRCVRYMLATKLDASSDESNAERTSFLVLEEMVGNQDVPSTVGGRKLGCKHGAVICSSLLFCRPSVRI